MPWVWICPAAVPLVTLYPSAWEVPLPVPVWVFQLMPRPRGVMPYPLPLPDCWNVLWVWVELYPTARFFTTLSATELLTASLRLRACALLVCSVLSA